MIMNGISLTDLLKNKPQVGHYLWDVVRDYFADEEHKKEFEVWYERKYGQPYKRG